MIALILFSGCEVAEKPKGFHLADVKIVCTTGMIRDCIQEIVGDSTEVIGLMGPGTDPHLYNPTQADMTALSEADIIIYNGLHLEGKMIDVLNNMKRRKYVFAVADGISKDRLINQTDIEDAYDPHLWFDVALWNDGIKSVADSVIELFPRSRDMLGRNLVVFNNELQLLDGRVKDVMSAIPEERRVMVTAHDAFSYFGKAYGIEVRGLQGISTTAGVAIKDVKELVTFLTERQVHTIFIESSVPPQALESVIEGCAAKGHTIEVGGMLYSDAMGPEGTAEGTYTGMIEHNLGLLQKAFTRQTNPEPTASE